MVVVRTADYLKRLNKNMINYEAIKIKLSSCLHAKLAQMFLCVHHHAAC